MKTPNETTMAVRENDRNLASLARTSKDGHWRTFHKHAGLMQFIPSEAYYARVKVRGKSVRASLETDAFTTAKHKLAGASFQTRPAGH